jgi:folate-binding protein YgfZ
MPLFADLTAQLGGVVALKGKDVRRFANGMFTNNVQDLPVGQVQRSAMCDAKGRILGLLDLALPADDLAILVLEGMAAADFEAHYGKYVIMDDVEIEDRTARTRVFTLQGDGAADSLRAAGLPVPDGYSDGIWRRDRGGRGFDLLAASEPSIAAERVGVNSIEVLRVEAGKVRWPVDAPGRFLLQELGLRDEVCHFEKGCYVGQEIIHRVDVMGTLKRALAGVRADGPLAGGDWEVSVGGQVVGKLTSPVESPRHGWIGLAVLRKPHDEPGTAVQLVSGDRTVAGRVSGLPF